MIDETQVQKLMSLDLSKYEARVYLALLGYEESSAVEVADRAGVPRQRVYDVLASLHDWGLVMPKDGRPVRHTALDPSVGLNAYLETRRRQQQIEIERMADQIEIIISELEPTTNGSSGPDGHPVQQKKPLGGF
jgi:sugar-specific transcriptional regulator TrmB